MSNKEEIEEVEEIVEENIEEIIDSVGDSDISDKIVPLFEASQHIIMSMIRDLTSVREMFLNVQPYEAMELLDTLKGDHEILRKTSELMIELMEVETSVLEDDEDDDDSVSTVVPEDIDPEKEL